MNIKRLTACIVLAVSMLVQLTAFADVPEGATDYTNSYNDNDLTIIDTTSSKTVLIYRVQDDIGTEVEFTDEEIVYANQSNTGFDAATGFMLKENPQPGLYKVLLGGNGSEPTVGYLEIDMAREMGTDASEDYMESYTNSEGETVYKKGFLSTVSAEECNAYKSIKLVNDRLVGTWSIAGDESSTVTTGEGEVLIGIQIYNIPDEDTAKALNVYLSEEDITSAAEVDAE